MKTRNVYGHQELGILYFPNALPKSASQLLSRWIQRDPDLLDELTNAGYRKGQRLYTPKQISIIFDHLGKPEFND